jgi:hypothetical protein
MADDVKAVVDEQAVQHALNGCDAWSDDLIVGTVSGERSLLHIAKTLAAEVRRLHARAGNPPGEGVVVKFGAINDLCGRLAAENRIADAVIVGDLWKAYYALTAPRPAAPGDGEAMRLRAEVVRYRNALAAISLGADDNSAAAVDKVRDARRIARAALAPSAARDEQTGGGR